MLNNITQHGTARHNTTRHDTTRHNTTQHNTTRHDTTRHGTKVSLHAPVTMTCYFLQFLWLVIRSSEICGLIKLSSIVSKLFYPLVPKSFRLVNILWITSRTVEKNSKRFGGKVRFDEIKMKTRCRLNDNWYRFYFCIFVLSKRKREKKRRACNCL